MGGILPVRCRASSPGHGWHLALRTAITCTSPGTRMACGRRCTESREKMRPTLTRYMALKRLARDRKSVYTGLKNVGSSFRLVFSSFYYVTLGLLLLGGTI